MRRTEEEFKKEVLDRSGRYIRMRNARRRKTVTAVSAAAAVCIIAAGIWGAGINGGSKMSGSIPDGYVQNSGMAGDLENEEDIQLPGDNLNGKNADIVSVEVHIQKGEKVVSRCYSSREKVSQMTAALQEMETLKRQQEKLTHEMEEAINKIQEEIEKYQGENAGSESGEPSKGQNQQDEDKNDIGKKYSIIVTREDGTVKNYEIVDIEGDYYELQQKVKLTQQYMDSLQTLVNTMVTD